MEINPRHPVTRAVRHQWHKLLTILMVKQGIKHVVLTLADVNAIFDYKKGINITVRELEDGIHLRIVDDKEAARLAKEAGGAVDVTDN